jgi:hypothetical protein
MDIFVPNQSCHPTPVERHGKCGCLWPGVGALFRTYHEEHEGHEADAGIVNARDVSTAAGVPCGKREFMLHAAAWSTDIRFPWLIMMHRGSFVCFVCFVVVPGGNVEPLSSQPEELSRRLDDRSSDAWISLGEAEGRLKRDGV